MTRVLEAEHLGHPPQTEVQAARKSSCAQETGLLKYSVLIRTWNSLKTIPATLESLARQTVSPLAIVVVDSGSKDGTPDVLSRSCDVYPYEGAEFNYSVALNQGVQHVESDLVLMISSHTSLNNDKAIERAVDLLSRDSSIGAAYFTFEGGELAYDLIDAETFNGFNGIWNTCSLIRVGLVRERPFRPEVFSAEDQEWSRWLLTEKRMRIARFRGGGLKSQNPNDRSYQKRANEYVSIAYFTERKLLALRNIARIAIGAFGPRSTEIRDRLYKLWLAGRLLKCRWMEPHSRSRYVQES